MSTDEQEAVASYQALQTNLYEASGAALPGVALEFL